MSDTEEVVQPVVGESEADVLSRILNQTPKTVEPVKPAEGECINCANHGKKTNLTDGVCADCGYTQPVGY